MSKKESYTSKKEDAEKHLNNRSLIGIIMAEWENNHKVTCNECIHSISSYDFVDELSFRTNVECKLGHETDYRIPYSEHWDCKDYEEWTYLKAIVNTIKKFI